MKTYEITYLTLHEELSDAKTIAESLVSQNAKIVSVHPWTGRRKLTYPIKKQDQAFYTTAVFETEPSTIALLERDLQLNNEVLRALIVEFIPGIFHRATPTLDDNGRAGETKEKPISKPEEEAIESPAEVKAEPVVSESQKTDETASADSEEKPKRRRAKSSKEDTQALDEKLDALLNEDITK